MYTIDLSASYPELKKYRLRGKIENGKIVAYDERAELNKREDLEAICYVNDEIDLFFLQILSRQLDEEGEEAVHEKCGCQC